MKNIIDQHIMREAKKKKKYLIEESRRSLTNVTNGRDK